jgi:uncharacterized membrane protein
LVRSELMIPNPPIIAQELVGWGLHEGNFFVFSDWRIVGRAKQPSCFKICVENCLDNLTLLLYSFCFAQHEGNVLFCVVYFVCLLVTVVRSWN